MLENYLLEQLVAFAKTGTLSKAAQELHVTQPALSKSMRRLENEFGLPLFRRTHSHIELNKNGQVAVQYAQKALQANQAIIPATLAFDRRQHTLKIAGCSAMAIHRLTRLCQDCYPKLTLTTSLIDKPVPEELLQTEDYDLVIATANVENASLKRRLFLNEQLMLSVPLQSPLAAKKELSFADLAGLDILAHAGAGVWVDICRQQIPQANLLVQENMQTLRRLVQASALPTFSSSLTQGDKKLSGRVTLPITDQTAKVNYYLYCKRDDYRKFKALYQIF